ncbi:MAG: hypothetical protein IH585_10275 [Anaerolineaceae bacterium]|nr:hypothetical protein [Anaerolineaceae bacterium]
MKSILTKIAAVLAFIIGAMAVFAGAQVLLGNDPGYYVINWVPVYNYTAGILTVFITAILIWQGSKLAWFAAITTLSLHTLVMIILQTVHRDIVAVDSIRAMTIRMIAWVIILALMLAQSQKDKKTRRLNTVAKS